MRGTTTGPAKARFCAPGNRRCRELHEMLDFALRPCGSCVCAFDEAECRHLEILKKPRGQNGVPGLEIVTGHALRRREPPASAHIVAALYAPTGNVGNNFEAVLAFLDNAHRNGVELFLETEVTAPLVAEGRGTVLGIGTSRGAFLAPVVINAAGIHAGTLAALAGDESIRLRPTRGEYLLTDASAGVRGRAFSSPAPAKGERGLRWPGRHRPRDGRGPGGHGPSALGRYVRQRGGSGR